MSIKALERRCGSCRDMTGAERQTTVKSGAHLFRTTEATVECHGLQRLVDRFQQLARMVEPNAFDKVVGGETQFCDKAPRDATLTGAGDLG